MPPKGGRLIWLGTLVPSAYLLDFRTGRSFGEPQELQGSLSIGFFLSGALSEAAFEKLIAEQLSERTAQ